MLKITHNKKLIISILIFINLSFIAHSAFSQIFNEEQNPLSVKWREINAAGFRVIYPAELEKEAQRMANTISSIYPYVGKSLDRQNARIPILLQNRGVVANGFVQLAPKKSEFYTTPPQQFDSQDWLNNLAVHELRHVAQFDKLTGGKARPFPEDIYFAWFGLSIPVWFFEGDAVGIETALTESGRGRQPAWIMPYRTSLLEGRKFSYSKAYFGSDKDVTPGYYQLGYLMSSAIRKAYGKNIFDSVLTDIRKRPLRPYPFSSSLKKFTGSGTRAWFQKTTDLIRTAWGRQDQQTPSETYPALNPDTRIATDYLLPVRLGNGSILALKRSKAEADHLVLIDSGKQERRLQGIAYQEQPWFSYAAGLVVWDEIRYDPRYRQRNYSVVCSYNLETGKTKKLSSRSRIFSPSLSADGKKIVAVRFDLANHCELVEMDAATGAVIKVLPNPENLILQTPAYDQEASHIVYVSVSEAGKALWSTDRQGKKQQILGNTRQQLSRPVYFRQGIAFNAHYNGIDNIYHIDTLSKKIIALSASKYGAQNLRPSGSSSFLFSNYGLKGYEIAAASAPAPTEEAALPLEDQEPASGFVDFGAETEKQEATGTVFRQLPDSSYASKPYRTLAQLFNVHSVIPVIQDEYNGGIQLRSNNLLNTFDFFAEADYHRDLGRFEYSSGIAYKALYPILKATYRNRPRRTFYLSKAGMQQGDWRENNVQLQASLPISINALSDTYNFSFNTISSYTQRYMTENLPSGFARSVIFPLEYNFTFTHSTRLAERDIAPRWAQIFRTVYSHQPFDRRLKGDLFAAEGYLYFPGILSNHSFLLNFNYQVASGVRKYDQEINTVYGYNNIPAKSVLKNTLLLNYRFPFAFPDAELGPLAYIRNLRAGIFCHYENFGTETRWSEPKTYGFELRSSMHLLRYQPLVDVGTRFVFVNKLYHQNPILELIFNYSF